MKWVSHRAAPENIIRNKLKKLRHKKNQKKLLLSLHITFAAAFIFFGVLFGIGTVYGDSMVPVLQDGDMILIWRLEKRYTYGEIVSFKKEGSNCIKRVIALPGDTIEIRDDQYLSINGEQIKESDIYSPTDKKEAGIVYPLTLGADEYFLLGDNRPQSRDSRSYGAVHRENIRGKVILVFRSMMK